jgi:FkbM family methyltransferase
LLPDPIRQPMGRFFIGTVYQGWLRPAMGWWFDVSGGRFRVDGCEIEVPKDLTTRSYRAAFVTGEYEEEERELIRRLLRPEDRVMELGACIGVVSCVTNRLLKDRKKHLVVEANPKLIPWIERNRVRNQADFTIEHCAVSRKPEVTFFIHPEYIVGGSSQQETSLPVTVRGCSLEQLNARHGPFNVMIMDVEGAEVEVLPDAGELLKGFRLVIVELHEWAASEAALDRCRQTMAAAGLRKVAAAGRTEAWERPEPARS